VITSTGTTSPRDHVVVFYASDRELIEVAGEFVLDTLAAGGVAIVIATARHRLTLDVWLGSAGVDVAAATAAGSFVELDAAGTLGQFMLNDRPDPAAFWQVISPLLQDGGRDGRPVQVFGEMVGLLWASGRPEVAIEVEALWNEMAAQHQFRLVCGYAASSDTDPEVSDALAQVCSAHCQTIGQRPEFGLAPSD
jgi:hypothetical protein